MMDVPHAVCALTEPTRTLRQIQKRQRDPGPGRY